MYSNNQIMPPPVFHNQVPVPAIPEQSHYPPPSPQNYRQPQPGACHGHHQVQVPGANYPPPSPQNYPQPHLPGGCHQHHHHQGTGKVQVPGISIPNHQQYYPPPPPTHQYYLPHVGFHHQYPAGTEEVPWSTGLFDCMSDVPNSCITCCCPWVTFGEIAEIVDQGSTSCVANGALYALLAWFTVSPCIYSCFYRSRMRSQYNLEDSLCGDCCVHIWCEHCALCQEYRELKYRGYNMYLGWHGTMQMQSRGMPTAPMVYKGMER